MNIQNQPHVKMAETTYFEWLFLQLIEKPQQKLMPARVPTRAR
jgi:hypothetical protein